MTKQKERPGNQTPSTAYVDESELSRMKVDQLRAEARELGISGVSEMRKDDLVHAVAKPGGYRDTSGRGVRTGPASSKAIKYSQEIDTPNDEPERPGRSLVTTSHDVIRQWAEARKAKPATVRRAISSVWRIPAAKMPEVASPQLPCART
jgi:hypothetical protein